MKVAVLDINGKDTGRKVELSTEVFGIEPNDHAIYLDVTQYLANQRQGTHKAKERGEVAGSTRKIKRQKGTGTARAGSLKNPLFRGGGRMFGPRPRKYTIKLNKKVKRLARKSVLSAKASNGNLVVIEDFSFEAPKTKEYVNILNNIGVQDSRSLVVTSDYEKELQLSSRNIKQSKVIRAVDMNTYDVLNAGTLVIAEGALEKIKESLA